MGRSRSPSGGRDRSRSRKRSRSRERSRSRNRSRSRSQNRGRPRSRSRGGREFCKDYTRGECNRGSGCRFSHDFKPAIPARQDAPPSGGCGMPPPDRPGGPLATYDRFGREMCGDFKRGDCRRGERCRYSHGDGHRPPPGMGGPMMGMPPMMGPMGHGPPMVPPMGMPGMMGPMGMMPPFMGMPPPMGVPPHMGMPPMGMHGGMHHPMGGPPAGMAAQGRSRSTSRSVSRGRGHSRKNGKDIEPTVRKRVPIDIDEL
mmetsp:Transcript_102885/g.273571  ORF Transcript_102885/g.273571 Transcript_102885/m.273571 type:complete len:257 (-) Transcript_102885:285-1055(-)